jgi:hypothetical protein
MIHQRLDVRNRDVFTLRVRAARLICIRLGQTLNYPVTLSLNELRRHQGLDVTDRNFLRVGTKPIRVPHAVDTTIARVSNPVTV